MIFSIILILCMNVSAHKHDYTPKWSYKPVVSILYPDNACPSVRPSVCASRKWEVLVVTRYNVLRFPVGFPVGQSANSEWWVASRLQPWSLSQQFDATKRHVPNNGRGMLCLCRDFPIAR